MGRGGGGGMREAKSVTSGYYDTNVFQTVNESVLVPSPLLFSLCIIRLSFFLSFFVLFFVSLWLSPIFLLLVSSSAPLSSFSFSSSSSYSSCCCLLLSASFSVCVVFLSLFLCPFISFWLLS